MSSAHRRIGLLFSSSGATTIPEAGLLEASLLAVEHCNAEFGAALEPLVADIRSDPETAARAAHQLASQGAEILVGCYTSACRKALIPVLEETGTSLVYPTIYEGEEMHPRIFYFGAVPNQTVDPLLSWTTSNLSTQFVLVGSDYIYPRSVNRQARAFIEAFGGRVLDDQYFPLGCEDFTRFLRGSRTLRGRPPPVVFSTLVGGSIPAFYRQYREAGLRGAIVSPITSERELGCLGAEAAAGHYFADGHLGDPRSPAHEAFVAAYQRCYGPKPVNGMMAAVYEAVRLLGRAPPRGGHQGVREVRDALATSLRAPRQELPRGHVALDPRSQHAWMWTRVARVGDHGQIETVWTSPGPMPPRPLGDRGAEAGRAGVAGPVPVASAPAGDAFEDLIGEDAAFKECLRMARIAARTSAPVLLTGETGTGKELFARSIHRASARSGGPFVAVNCAAMPAELIESELFGYAPGAFTGARREGRKGRFELAAGGTLFLDEITELPLELQAVLLRALQEKRISPVGGGREIDIDVRVVAATNREIAPEVAASSHLRSDLYFRLNVFRIDIPPLRSRSADLPALADAILSRLERAHGHRVEMTARARAAVTSYAWPGNVRELQNALERAFHVCGDGPLDACHLPDVVAAAAAGAGEPVEPSGYGAPRDPARFDEERQVISRAILTSGHNLSRASRVLGISRSTLYRRLKALKIDIPDQYGPRGTEPLSSAR